QRLRYPLTVYVSSRVLYFLLAVIVGAAQHWSLKHELSNWDGLWYRRVAGLGYPDHTLHIQSTLGFFPLYPMLMWLVQHMFVCSIFLAGILVSGVGGFITTVLIERLSAGWWGREASRRAVLLFCFFPGSIVFSMVYSEGVLLPLVAGCLLALERRRWLLAGVLAAFATAVGPTAVAIIPACAVAALMEIRRRGWKPNRALIAPVLAPLGIVAFGAFLWVWTGSPFASYYAQHHEWSEKTNPLALVTIVIRLITESHFTHSFVSINLNYISGLIGAVFLASALYLLVKMRPHISAPALVWTLGVGFLAVTSENVPPNPRLLITAFPAVLVVAYRFKGKAFNRMMVLSVSLLVVMSAASWVSTALRP
ncbi:MAG TPA: mannosyltransferase family protein, partial [Solirubrobacteraceae bacterium]